MNREQKRKAARELDLKSPCSITEAVQIARGVAEDVVMDYSRQTRPLHVSVSLQVEILKDLVISSGLITEEEFREKYSEKVIEFNRLQQQTQESFEPENPSMEPVVSDIEVSVEER